MSSALRPFRNRLASLYLVEGLKLEDIRTLMKNEQSIDVGRSTYERLFKEWGLKKNKKVKGWSWVSHRIQKRQKNGQKSRLYINGKHVPAEVLRKEVSRHVSTLEQALQRAETSPIPQTPDGYAILTPPPHGAAMTPGQSASSVPLACPSSLALASITDGSGTADVDTAGHAVAVEPVEGGEADAHCQDELIRLGIDSITLALYSLENSFRLFSIRLTMLEHKLVALKIM